jgi:hypothetical protein
MKIIGAGLPRTATLSQKIALEILGHGPCYHMVNILADLSLVPQWTAAFEGGSDWDSVFGEHEATLDWPGAFFYEELIETYPDAKVLLSVRDPEAWARSMLDTIWGVLYGDTLIHDLSSARVRVDDGWRQYIDLMTNMWRKSGLLDGVVDADTLARGMERYVDEVKANVPAERLLVWNATDSWEPLCEFLGAPVPEAPFPRVNDSRMFAERIVDGSLAAISAWKSQEMAPATE